ncbi:hypothetical protein BU24DRAFT_423773 [Aaosphaeria arxii CBS 175.79]|uniref:Copper acquisition factor BIM1-like domain-containing protein n=1 Tax=Aaosphaeria arxii CBS 175.79 TaxID=1450172 RepID=A0A6A5XPV4_9PLEO|nr:uncharacterized protein BU24DRAFT_423773 [Aaosphaeria arxii CBS 175.79]KAF2014867.1 hypothetical protein BU24DRAFT_423773 [Aaosphaeria arxii CBS 175.79]
MHLSLLASLALLFSIGQGQTHGEGEEGKSMGPVAFLWPADRPWDAADDNIGPCGSPEGVSNRTQFPLTQGSVALSIADEAYKVAFRISFSNNPTKQEDFEAITGNVSEIDPGHQCYKLNQIEGKTTGDNATIQMEYWAEFEGENDGKNQSFFACADVTFVQAKDFTTQVPCFNVTSEEFIEPTPSASPSASATGSSSGASSTSGVPAESGKGSSGGGLSTGAKAGIAVGAIVGGLGLIGAIAFFVFRRGKATGLKNKDAYELRAKKLNNDNEGTSTASA